MKTILTLMAALLLFNASQAQEIVIMGTNDLHGALLATESKTKDKEPIAYSIGGMNVLGGYVDILREAYKDSFLFLDAGDQWQGTLESNFYEGQTMMDAFGLLGLNATAIGNHEFDFGPVGTSEDGDPQGALKLRIEEASYPFLSANLKILDQEEVPQKISNLYPYQLYKLNGVKVAVLGITTEYTPVTTRSKFVKNVELAPILETTQKYVQKLRKQADIVVLLAHAGTRCKKTDEDPLYNNKIRSISPLGDQACDQKEELTQLLNALPAGYVDAVIAGHNHEIVHHWINGMPVIQSGKSGNYFHVLHMNYDKKTKKTTTQIEGPVPVCSKFFINENTCDGKQPSPSTGRGPMTVDATYLGKIIVKKAEVDTLIADVNAKLKPIKEEVITHIDEAITHERHTEGVMGDWIADGIRWSVNADFAVVNRGAIREGFPNIGDVTFNDVYRALPFDNFISKLKVTGKELKLILQIAQNGEEGVFPVSNLQITMDPVQGIDDDVLMSMREDLNEDGKKDRWETNRHLEIFDIRSGTPETIQDNKVYTLATLDFLVSGGDNMGWVFKKIPLNRVSLMEGGLFRDEMIRYLQHLKNIDVSIQQSIGTTPRLLIRNP